jgi:hypothetical protein
LNTKAINALADHPATMEALAGHEMLHRLRVLRGDDIDDEGDIHEERFVEDAVNQEARRYGFAVDALLDFVG